MLRCTLDLRRPDAPSDLFRIQFATAIRALGAPSENSPYEAGRRFREAFAGLDPSSPDAGDRTEPLRLTGAPTECYASEVGHDIEGALQAEGTIALSFEHSGDSLSVALRHAWLPPNPSVEFSATRDDSQKAQVVATSIRTYTPPSDLIRDPGPLDGLEVAIRRRHDRVRVATNALEGYSVPQTGWLSRIRRAVGAKR